MLEKSVKDFEESIISTIKAICKNDKIDVEFDLETIDFRQINQNFFSLSHKISLPKINNQNPERLNLIRATSDLAALYLSFHQASIHQEYYFENSKEQKLFDDFEKFRLLVKGSLLYQGVAINLEKLIGKAIDEISSKLGLVPILLLKNLSIKSSKIQNHLNAFDKILSEKLSAKINVLSKLIDDQEQFALSSKEIIEELRSFDNKSEAEEKSDNSENQADENNQKQDSENPQKSEEKQTSKAEILDGKDSEIQPSPENLQLLDFAEEDLQNPIDLNQKNNPNQQIKFIPEYKIFTKKYDQIIYAAELSNRQELENLRHQLDVKLSKLQNISGKLTAKLKRKLLSKKNVFHQYNREEGIIDRKKIGQIIANPFSENNYVIINQNQYQDTVISMLLDNSGSMRGQPIVMSAMVCEIIAKILERFNIKTEILGFTTVDWRGGKSRKLWELSGKPKNPGRLSDLRHIIYKNADQSFKKSRINLGLMLKEGILKENIDGEALIWAKERLINRSEQRKILMIISDGTPVDDSTNSHNDHPILADHLHQVIGKLEKHSDLEIAAIGIGHDIGDFYHNFITINNIDELGDVMIDKICNML